MDIVAVFDLTSLLETIYTISKVAIGLGLVIFFHEMGHFLAAKWCNVNVERFSIGFGPIIWSRKWGETEYAFSVIPFGGYVKMLGQDDMDPSQLSSEEIAEDPRSYSAKTVWQRMLIISAGVIVNVVTAVLFFALAFQMGVETVPAIVGNVQSGMPAWEAGFKRGDTITRINGREVDSFSGIQRGIALSRGNITVKGFHRDGTTFEFTITPDNSGKLRLIGVAPTAALKLAKFAEDDAPAVTEGSPAASAVPSFQEGDIFRKVGDVEITDYVQLQNHLARNRNVPLDFHIQRKDASKDDLTKIQVAANPFRTLGLVMDIGPIVSIQKGSPADQAGLQVGDQIVAIGTNVLGTNLNPLKLNDAALKSDNILEIRISRPSSEPGPKEHTLPVHPQNESAWLNQPGSPTTPFSVPSLGIAFHLKPTIMNVVADSPAARANIVPNERILKFTMKSSEEPDDDKKDFVLDFSNPETPENETPDWSFAFWKMQQNPNRKVVLTVANTKGEAREVPLTTHREEDWFFPERGPLLTSLVKIKKADNIGAATAMGFTHTRTTIIDLYLTLRNLFSGDISPKQLSGPVGIAKVAYQAAGLGLPHLLLFLGFLSVNLAVLNFLPIPVLDGGHMVFLCWEAITRKKPSERVLVAATYCGMAFVLGLMCFVLYLDIFVHRAGGN